MDAKKYLSNIEVLETKIEQIKIEYQDLLNISKIYSSKKMKALEKKLLQIISDLTKERCEIINKISELPKKNHREFLFKKYVECKKIDLIAEEMMYSYNHIVHLHKMALKEFKKLYADTID